MKKAAEAKMKKAPSIKNERAQKLIKSVSGRPVILTFDLDENLEKDPIKKLAWDSWQTVLSDKFEFHILNKEDVLPFIGDLKGHYESYLSLYFMMQEVPVIYMEPYTYVYKDISDFVESHKNYRSSQIIISSGKYDQSYIDEMNGYMDDKPISVDISEDKKENEYLNRIDPLTVTDYIDYKPHCVINILSQKEIERKDMGGYMKFMDDAQMEDLYVINDTISDIDTSERKDIYKVSYIKRIKGKSDDFMINLLKNCLDYYPHAKKNNRRYYNIRPEDYKPVIAACVGE